MTYSQTELRVRIAIANDFANRAKDYFERNPGELSALKYLVESKFEETVKDNSSVEIMKKEFSGKLTIDFLVQEVADGWIKDYSEIKNSLDAKIKDLPDDEITQVLAGFSDIFSVHIEGKQAIIDYLVKLAETQGIKYAKKSGIIAEAVRKVYPTPDDYLASHREFAKSLFGLMSVSVKGDLGKAMEECTLIIAESNQRTIYQEDIKAIYGDESKSEDWTSNYREDKNDPR